MLAANYDITLDRSVPYAFTLTINTVDGVLNFDPLTYYFYGHIRDAETKIKVAQFVFSVPEPTLGAVLISLPEEVTDTFRGGTDAYEYDIVMDLEDVKRRLLFGTISVRTQVTNI